MQQGVQYELRANRHTRAGEATSAAAELKSVGRVGEIAGDMHLHAITRSVQGRPTIEKHAENGRGRKVILAQRYAQDSQTKQTKEEVPMTNEPAEAIKAYLEERSAQNPEVLTDFLRGNLDPTVQLITDSLQANIKELSSEAPPPVIFKAQLEDAFKNIGVLRLINSELASYYHIQVMLVVRQRANVRLSPVIAGMLKELEEKTNATRKKPKEEQKNEELERPKKLNQDEATDSKDAMGVLKRGIVSQEMLDHREYPAIREEVKAQLLHEAKKHSSSLTTTVPEEEIDKAVVQEFEKRTKKQDNSQQLAA